MGGRREEDRWSVWDKRLRSSVIFVVGIVVAIHEAFVRDEPELYMLLFSLTLMGIPPVLKADEMRRAASRLSPMAESERDDEGR